MPKAQNFFCRSFPDSCRVKVNFESNIAWQPLNLNMCFMYKKKSCYFNYPWNFFFKIHVKFSITCLAARLLVSIYKAPLAFSLITISFRLAGWRDNFDFDFDFWFWLLAGWRDNFDKLATRWWVKSRRRGEPLFAAHCSSATHFWISKLCHSCL